MAAILVPDINLRRRRRRLEQHWRQILQEDRVDEHVSTPLLAPSSASALDSRTLVPRRSQTPSRMLERVSSPRHGSHPALSGMQRGVTQDMATHLEGATGDEAYGPRNTTNRRSITSSGGSPGRASVLSVRSNQDDENGVLDGIDMPSLASLSAPQSDSAAAPQSPSHGMGLERGRVAAASAARVTVHTKPAKSTEGSQSPGPTLGDVMVAISRNETDTDELDFSFLLKRDKRLGAEGCAAVARALETNRTVRRLIIREHDVGDHGAAAIAAMLCRNSTLEYVDLCGCSITDDGAEALAQALYGHASLTHLLLWSNRITDRGAAALADAIKCNCSLLYLGLVQNAIAQAGAQALLDALEVNIQLETLNLATNEEVPVWLLAQIRLVLARNRLEGPRTRTTWGLESAPGSTSVRTEDDDSVSLQESNAHSDMNPGSERSCADQSYSDSDASGFLSCSGATASAISGDGIWI